MLEGGSCTFAVVLEQHDRLKPGVTEQVVEAALQGEQHRLDLPDRLLSQE
jgi:hypothetical protein